jgi:hypothetical protein
MDLSSDPLQHPPGSSPPYNDSMDTEQTPAGSSSPALPALTLNSTARVGLGLLSGADAGLSSPFSFSGLSASAHRPTAALPRKRGIQTEQHEPRAKEPRTQDPQDSQDDDPNSLARSKILEARDLLLQACSLTKSRDEQSRLLDLLEVFREYTEKGKLAKSSNIIASQVASLETAVRKIETKAKALASTTLPPALPLALAPSVWTRLEPSRTDRDAGTVSETRFSKQLGHSLPCN